jgi:hypothetical protein
MMKMDAEHGDWKTVGTTYKKGDRVVWDGVELECKGGYELPSDTPKRRKMLFIKFCRNILDILIYAAVLLPLVLLDFPSLSIAEYAGRAIILGFFAAEINNIERVVRELFKNKENSV